MKSIRYSWAALVLLLSLFSCQHTRQEESLSHLDAVGDGRVYFTLQGGSLRATENSAPNAKLAALNEEKKINDITVVVFNEANTQVLEIIKDADIKYTDSSDKSKGGSFKLGDGKYHLRFIANGADLVNSNKITKGQPIDAFGKVLVETVPGRSGDKGKDFSSNFVMVSDKLPDPTTITNAGKNLGAVKLIRLAARIDVYNSVSDFAMTEITLQKCQKHSYLVAQSNNNSPSETSSESKSFKQTEQSAWFTSVKAVAGLYTYEQSQDQSDKFKLIVKGSFKGKSVKLEIPFKAADGTNLLLTRNHLYHVIINTQGVVPGPHPADGFQFTIKVLDWDDAAAFSYGDEDLDKIKDATPPITGKGTPLSYMAEYDVKDLNGTWDNDIDNFAPDYLKNLTWQVVKTAYQYPDGTSKLCTVGENGKKYFLPKKEEWLSIIPGGGTNIFDQNRSKDTKLPLGPLGSATEVEFGGRTYTMTGGLYNMGDKELYGAYIYTPKPEDGTHLYVIASYDLNTSNFAASKGKLEIKMAKVDKSTFDELTKGDFSINASAIKAKFSTLPADDVASRVLRAAGLWHGSSFNYQGTDGYYWSATESVGSNAWCMNFSSGCADVHSMSRAHGASVRVFARE